MKLKLLLLFTFAFVVTGFSQTANYRTHDLKGAGLKGHVKYVVRTMFGNKTMEFYSKSGKLLKSTFYNKNGQETGHETIDYDSEGRIVRIELIRNSNGFEVIEKYKYSNEGRTVKKITRRKNRGISDGDETKYFFDDKGRLVKSTALYHRRYGDSKEKYICEYDKNDNCVVVIFHERSNIYKTNKTYNKQGKVIKEVVYKDGKLYEKRTFKYNDKGDKSESCTDYTAQRKESSFMSSVPSIYKYKYSYVYDDHGNWIKKTEMRNGQKNPESSRLIEYYD